MAAFAALDQLNYDTLQLNRELLDNGPRQKSPRSLGLLCASAICRHGAEAAAEAVQTVPAHLASMLLREAIKSSQTAAMISIVANWPLSMLCFREVLPDPSYHDIFEGDMGLNVILFKGVISLTPQCRMRLLDLKGFPLNWNFAKLIVQMWPLLSLRRSQRNVKLLSKQVLKTSGLKDARLTKEIIPKLLECLIDHEMVKHPAFSIHIPKGQKLVVKIDRVEFSTDNAFFMDYLISNCLRELTPLVIDPVNIVIRPDLMFDDEILDSLAPFIAFTGQNNEAVEGIWVENLEDNVFFVTCPNLYKFCPNVTSLAFPNCNITLQEGRTRQRTFTRHKFTGMLGHFHSLARLDLSQNSFTGCLKEVLDALHRPLEYLSLRECDLCDSDLDDLAASVHSASLREVNLSRICGLFPEDSFAVTPTVLLRSVRSLRKLTVLHLVQNHIVNAHMDNFCTALQHDWPRLKGFNLSENDLSTDSVLKLVRTAARSPSMQFMRLPYTHNFDDIAVSESARINFVMKVTETLQGCGRSDIVFQVGGIGDVLTLL